MLQGTLVYKFLCGHVFSSLGYIDRNWIIWQLFHLLKNCQSVFRSSCTTLQCQQQCTRFPVSQNSSQHLLHLLDDCYPSGAEVLSVVFTCTPWWLIPLRILSSSYWLFLYLLQRMYIEILSLFWLLFLFVVELQQFFINSMCRIPSQIQLCVT